MSTVFNVAPCPSRRRQWLRNTVFSLGAVLISRKAYSTPVAPPSVDRAAVTTATGYRHTPHIDAYYRSASW